MSAIIINADDFGIHPGTNRSVAALVRRGVLRSTSLMANMLHAGDIADLVGAAPGLGVGLHVNLSQGAPVSPPAAVPTLVREDGSFHPPRALARRALLGRVSMADVRREVAAQIARARDLIGDRLDHWDSHQGVHRFEPVAGTVIATCRAHGIRAMRSHRHWFATGGAPGAVRAGWSTLGSLGVKRVAKEKYYAWLAWRAAQHFVVPDGLLVVPGATTRDVLRWIVRHDVQDAVLEIPVHPASDLDGLTGTRLLQARLDEHAYLMSDEFHDAVTSGRVRLLTFGDLVARAGVKGREELAATTL